MSGLPEREPEVFSAARATGVSAATHRFSNELRYRAGDHPGQTQLTPSYVLDLVREDLGGTLLLDPCTTPDNPTRAVVYYAPPQTDGLTQPWSRPDWSPSVFVNPPYGKAREPWVERCIAAGAKCQRVILLIPAATDTRIWQRAVSTSTAVVFIRGRVKFETLRPNRRRHAASHPSCLIGWNTYLDASTTLGIRAAYSQEHPS